MAAAQVMSEEEAMAKYLKKLEELTWNSKPLIDDLTRAAGQLERRGKCVVEVIQTRIMQVAGRRYQLDNLSLYSFCFIQVLMWCGCMLFLRIYVHMSLVDNGCIIIGAVCGW